MANRIAVMNAGVIQQVGTAWQIYTQPENTFVASFVGNMNFIEGKVTSTEDGHVEVAIDGLCLKTPKPTKPLNTVRLAVRPEDLSIVDDQGKDEAVHRSLRGRAAVDRGTAQAGAGSADTKRFLGVHQDTF